jgi:Fic family protein
VLSTPLLYLSAFFQATRQHYYDHLFNVTHNGDWSAWLIYFLNGVARQSEDSLSRASRINDLLELWRDQLTDSRATVSIRLLKRLAANPYITIKHASESLGITFGTAKRAIEQLEKLGIVQEMSGQQRSKLYCAKAILAIFEEDTLTDARTS